MVIPKGYKQTEVGVIPEDWDISSLENKYTLSAGGDLNRNDYSSHKTSETKFCIYSNSLTNNGIYGFCKNPKHVGNSITITGRGDIGHAEYREAPFSAIIRLLVCEPKKEINSFYVASFLNLTAPFPIESTGVPQLTVPQIKKVKIPFPGIEEQNCISEYISDIDDFLSTIKKLLAKKKAIKQGAMQELLTGKCRLPGFTGDWTTRRLSEICQLINGRAYSQNELLSEGKYRVLRLGNLFTNEHWYYSNLELPEKQYCVKGDLLYAWSATFGPHVWEGEKTIFHYHIWKIELIDRICKEYMYHYLKYDVHELMSELQGGTMVHLTKDTMEQRPILLPSYAEQAAIAGVLSDMDNEIEKLEQKLAKYRQIKQGMMQQLLTGKIRLIERSEPNE